MRAAAVEDPGRFHGDVARRELHWFVPGAGEAGSWLTYADGRWSGWDAKTLAPVAPELPADFAPWSRAFNDDEPPFFRWFEGGLTNAGFNEIDRHMLAGCGGETALVFEGDRWDGSKNDARGGPVESYAVTRKELMWEVARRSVALRSLGVEAGDRIALNMPNIPAQIYWIEAAKRIGAPYTPVFGGFSDKTLSDRIDDFGARVVITADGGHRNAQVIAFKAAFTDPALDNYLSVCVATDLLETALAALDLDGAEAETIRVRVEEAVKGEMTVERSDVMRGVGRAIAELAMKPAKASLARTKIAEALVASPRRVDAVIVEKHAHQPDMLWRGERDRWADELLAGAAAAMLDTARAAGFNVADEAALLALPDAEFVKAVWASSAPKPVDAEFPLFVIYTSGSTGKPKGVVHVHGGYLSGVAHTMKVVFDAKPGDVMYCVADPGWITGQSYLIAGPLATRVATVIAEGAPVYPNAGRFASIIERTRATIFKAGVTFLKTVMTDPESVADIRRYDLSSLKAATFCAEPTSPTVQEFGMREVTPWYANSYWATEHGGVAWTHFKGSDDFPLEPNARAYPLPWIFGDVWTEGEAEARTDVPNAPPTPYARDGEGAAVRPAPLGEKGEMVITAPYPYLARTVWGDKAGFRLEGDGAPAAWRGDAERWISGYWSRWSGVWAYTQGDFGMLHPDGSFSIHGRSDDVINVSGHRLGTEEIEGAILRDKAINPAGSPVGNVLVVGAPHKEKGLTPLAFVTPAPGRSLTSEDKRRLSDLVRTEKGSLATPADFLEVEAFPETRSGKYMRRMVRALVEDEDVGDVTTLKNPEAVESVRRAIRKWRTRQDASDAQEMFERYRYFRVQYNALPAGGRVATVTVANPPVNALNERALDELNVIVSALDQRADVKAVVFTGEGSNSFVAGADIRQFLDEIHTLDEARALPNNAHLAFKRIEAMTKPCVAAIQGVALGGGMEFALACHYRIAEPHARFGQPEINLRLLPGYGGTQRLPRLLAERRGEAGLADALELLLGGRSVDARSALEKGLVDEIAETHEDALSLAHARVRAFANGGGPLAEGAAAREAALAARSDPGPADLGGVLADPHLKMIAAQCAWAGRGSAYERCLEAIRTGWTDGVAAGLEREASLFSEAVIDPDGGKTGIRDFMEKRAKPLPIRRNGARLRVGNEALARELEEAGDLLPLGAPFFPGVAAMPKWQYAQGVHKDLETGAPRHGEPKDAEVTLIAPTPEPGANDAVVYVLASEVNFNDIWAITGVPVSAFDSHEEDIQTTGSGGIGLVAALGPEARREGRLRIGDLVTVYSGTSDLLSPLAGLDPMYADFAIQGYETPTGSHAQFLVTQAPQLHPVPGDLTLEEAGAYTLNLGTVARALYTTLRIEAGRRIFIEGSATGTGFDALKTAIGEGLLATGLVSSPARAEAVKAAGAVGAIDRKKDAYAGLFTAVPEHADEAKAWERAGEPILADFRAQNDGDLADYAVSHAGETAFPRTFQILKPGGVLTFYGASSGYHFTFMGKAGEASPAEMLRRAGLRGSESLLILYGPASRDLADPVGLEIMETVRAFGARAVVATTTDGQKEFVLSLGFEDAVAGVFSLEGLKRRLGDQFQWPERMPRLPEATRDIAAFREAVRDFQERTMKPFGAAIGKILRSPDNPRGAPDVVFERAGLDSLGVTSALVKPFTGRIVYSEDLAGRRFSFYAPQVWTRQRRILMPTAEIRGTHLCNAYEVTRMNDLIAAGRLRPTPPTVVPWDELPAAHQSMWENAHSGATYLVDHALPELGLRTRDELFEAWSLKQKS